ncbi:hypothetical protein BDZ94DRAFT_1249217 [Collybia nuda]|uniref:Uncharacterized protein n=1 Tax=Collybia nuda TaxID=64659 RepID=A0A9P5YF42_9AGAR|nr:hypothetical protein BDZ94DRAFT_1249217 [Collybia nuda]
MSIVSSYFSSRSTAFGINAQVASLMDSILAIGVGLAVRFVIDLVSHHDVKLTGTLVGLWEGVVMQHFLRKMPASFDPYVAYGVRLFVDFLFTESVPRLVLVVVWTGMGIIFADIAPALWVDVGMRRIWRRFRRDLYVISKSVPSVPLFARPRTVRFSPSRTTSVISNTPPSVFTATTENPARLSPPTPAPRKRAVPGAFPGDVSETETDISVSQRSETSTTPGGTKHRFSTFRRYQATFETGSEISSGFNDLDEGNISSSESSCSTEIADPSAANPSEIPDYEEEEEVVRIKDKGKGREEDRDITPKMRDIVLPPTPSDSFAFHLGRNEPVEAQPPVAEVPNIPDQLDDDWENISRREAVPTPPLRSSPEIPPTPPAKDSTSLPTRIPSPPPQQVPPPTETRPAEQPPPFQNETVAPTSTNLIEDLVNFGAEDPWGSQQTDYLAPSQPVGQPTLENNTGPTGEPTTSSAQFDALFDTRHDSRTPPPPFQDIYDQAQPDQQRGSLFKPNEDPTNLIEQANFESSTAALANDATDPGNIESNEPTTNEQTTIENNDIVGAPAFQQQQQQQESEESSNLPVPEALSQPEIPTAPEAQAIPPPSPAPTVESLLPELTSERMKQALKLRNQVIELKNEIEELKRQRSAAEADGEDGADIVVQRTASIDAAQKKLKRLNEKAAGRYTALKASSDGNIPKNKLDLSDVTLPDVVSRIEQITTLLLLTNQSMLNITLKLTNNKKQKQKITSWLDECNLTYRDTARIIFVNLPSS